MELLFNNSHAISSENVKFALRKNGKMQIGTYILPIQGHPRSSISVPTTTFGVMTWSRGRQIDGIEVSVILTQAEEIICWSHITNVISR